MSRNAVLALVAGALVLGLGPRAAMAEKYEDKKLGFSLNHPKKWKKMPLAAEDNWVVAKFVCPRDYEWSDAKTNSYAWHKPWIDVVIIPHAVRDMQGASVEKTEKGVKVTREIPWKNMKEYLDKTCQRLGGFHFSGEETGEVNGMKVTKYEITVDKLVDGERRVYGWAFETEDAVYGLVSEILAHHEKRLGAEVVRAFESFKTFKRTGALPNTARTGDDIVIEDDDDDEEISDEDQKSKRDANYRRTLKRLTENLDKDWGVTESKNFTAISHADRKYTKNVLAHAEALRGWLDKNMGYVGSGHVGKVIIRICADDEEYNAYRQSRGWRQGNVEVVTYQDKEGWGDWAMESLNRGIFTVWMRDKNDNLAWGAPNWIGYGLASFIEGAKSKGRKLEFRADDWENVQMKELRRADKLLTARSFFTLTSEELWSNHENRAQTGFFVKFLIVGKGSSGKYKNVFSDYVKNLIFLLDEAEAEEPDDTADKEPQSEEEETEMFRERQNAWREQERERLAQLVEQTFEGWNDKSWNKFNNVYWKDVK